MLNRLQFEWGNAPIGPARWLSLAQNDGGGNSNIESFNTLEDIKNPKAADIEEIKVWRGSRIDGIEVRESA